MKSVTMILFLISFLFFWGMVRYLLALKRPGVFPPKQVLKKKAAALAGGGGIFLVVAILFSNF
jgi:hypothetical protein